MRQPGIQTDAPQAASWSVAPLLHRFNDRYRHQAALGAVLLLPILALYSRSLGDALLSLVALLFLGECVAIRNWRWIVAPWTALALAFWAWQLGVSIALGDGHQILEALVLVRLFAFVAALENWVLADTQARHRLGLVVLAVETLGRDRVLAAVSHRDKSVRLPAVW